MPRNFCWLLFFLITIFIVIIEHFLIRQAIATRTFFVFFEVIFLGCLSAIFLILTLQQIISIYSPPLVQEKKNSTGLNFRRVMAAFLDLVSIGIVFPLIERGTLYYSPTGGVHGFDEAVFPFIFMFLWFLISQLFFPMKWGQTPGMMICRIRFYRTTSEPMKAKYYWIRAILLPFSFIILIILPWPILRIFMKRTPLEIINWHNRFARININF